MSSESRNKNIKTQIRSAGKSLNQSDDLLTESDLSKMSSVDQSASRMRNFQKLKISNSSNDVICVLRNYSTFGQVVLKPFGCISWKQNPETKVTDWIVDFVSRNSAGKLPKLKKNQWIITVFIEITYCTKKNWSQGKKENLQKGGEIKEKNLFCAIQYCETFCCEVYIAEDDLKIGLRSSIYG